MWRRMSVYLSVQRLISVRWIDIMYYRHQSVLLTSRFLNHYDENNISGF